MDMSVFDHVTSGSKPDEHQERLLNRPAVRRIILTLVQYPEGLSVTEISRHAFVAKSSLTGGCYLKDMRAAGLVHICGWQKGANGYRTRLYAAGSGRDTPKPAFKDQDRNSEGLRKIIAALERCGPMSYKESANATGLSPNTIKNCRYMQILLDQRRIHITSWRRQRNGHFIPIYKAGSGENIAKPDPLSNRERSSRWRRSKYSHISMSSFVTQLYMINNHDYDEYPGVCPEIGRIEVGAYPSYRSPMVAQGNPMLVE